jgi:hypothetical protein
MLALSFGSLIPFISSVLSIIKIIPCPRIAAFVSNAALVGAFVAVFLVAYLLYGNLNVTYIFLMSIWPWMAIATVIARLHIGRDRELSAFSPLIHLPIIGFLGGGSMIGMLIALKSMTVTDCVVLCFLDPIWSAVFHSSLIGRIPYFTRYTRTFAFLILLVFIYLYGQAYSGGVVRIFMDSVTFMSWADTLPVSTYMLFLGSRLAYSLKCSYLKFAFIPTEVDQTQEFKSLFPSFPFPIRFRLDAIFDSGLVEDYMHAIGPTGTKDMFMLTDNLYMLPMASIASLMIERGAGLDSGLAAAAQIPGAPPIGVSYLLIAIFILSVGLAPAASSRILFDRGSSPHEWAGIPIVVQLFFIGVDVLYTNPYISRFQTVCVGALAVMSLNLRSDLWLCFKRNYYTMSLRELEFLQPSCIRAAQKQIFADALVKTGTEDFGTLLLETAVHHGNNIKDYLNEPEGKKKVWDPNPGARAAWKLAGSLVIRSIRSRKERLGIQKKKTEEDRSYMASVVQTFIKRVGARPNSN